MTYLRCDRKTAKRNHKTPCELTGVPIDKGDRYISFAGVHYGEFSAYKAHEIINQICSEQSHGEWSLGDAHEYLRCWLKQHLGDLNHYPEEPNETRMALDAAWDYWQSCNLA